MLAGKMWEANVRSLLKRILLVNLFPLGLVCTAYIFIMYSKTRQHSSRMRTPHPPLWFLLGVWGGGLPYTHPLPRTHYTPQDGPWDGPPPAKKMGPETGSNIIQSPPTEWQTGVKTLPCPNFVCGWWNDTYRTMYFPREKNSMNWNENTHQAV